ncbi:MAG: superoxide dismutase [Methylococcales bacterium]|nr:superoxide dismutase [Methylococcales bacterium]
MTEISRRKFLTAASIASATVATIALGGSRLVMAADAPAVIPEAAPVFPAPPLPYAEAALEPVISARTVGFHYNKHQLGALKSLNDALRLPENSQYMGKSINAIMRATANKPAMNKVFNGAASVVNHDFYWGSMMPNGGDAVKPTGKLLTLIDTAFGDYATFKTKFRDLGVAHTGSGYLWLVEHKGKLKIMTLNNLDNPEIHGLKPLLTIDIYEHAYYLDYQNLRKDYLQAVIDKLLNWNAAAVRLNA